MARPGSYFGMNGTRAGMNAGRLWAIMSLPAFCLFAALPLFAQSSAGPDAWTVLNASAGLDLRDASNRPVSREALARQMSAGSRGLLRQACSRAQARLLELLERSGLLSCALRGQGRDAGRGRPQAALSPLREPELWPSAAPALALVRPVSRDVSTDSTKPESLPAIVFLPLRC